MALGRADGTYENDTAGHVHGGAEAAPEHDVVGVEEELAARSLQFTVSWVLDDTRVVPSSPM